MPRKPPSTPPVNKGTGKGWTRSVSSGGTGRVYHKCTRRGRWYMWYVHRMVVAQALLESGYLGWEPVDPDRPIPPGMHVDHVDNRPDHNCLGNLVLLQAEIHASISRAHQLYVVRERDQREAEANREWMARYGVVM